MVSNERSCLKEYTCYMKALAPTNQKLLSRLKVFAEEWTERWTE
jgi:hypothetical protein